VLKGEGFYGEIKSRDPFLTVDDSLQLHLSRKDLEYAEFPIVNLKDDTYLIIITESDFEVDVYGVELLRSGKVVSNRIIDLRTSLTSFREASNFSLTIKLSL